MVRPYLPSRGAESRGRRRRRRARGGANRAAVGPGVRRLLGYTARRASGQRRGPGKGGAGLRVRRFAPYWFEVEATGYLGESGRSALRLDASYELLLTQRLVLQPRVEANFYGRSDPERGLGSGLSEVSAALRLRYEIRRELAPYFGVEWVGKYGDSKEFTRAAGDDPRETRVVVGLRAWF